MSHSYKADTKLKSQRESISSCKGVSGGIFPFDQIKETATRIYETIKGPRKHAPPNIRNLLKNDGDKEISKLWVCRSPINTVVDKVINFISVGLWSKYKREYSYDDLFHLYLICQLKNGKYVRLEKNHVVTVTYNPSVDFGKCMSVEFNGNLTMKNLVENPNKILGDSFWLYNASTNNCQVWIDNILKYNGLLTDKLHDFIMQKASKIIEKLPSYTQKIIDTVTDIAGRADILIKGKAKFTNKK